MSIHQCPIHHRDLLLSGESLICCAPGGCDYKRSAHIFDEEYKKPPISTGKCPIHNKNLVENKVSDALTEYSCPEANCRYLIYMFSDGDNISCGVIHNFDIVQLPSDMYAPDGMTGVLRYAGVRVRNIIFKPEYWFDVALIILCVLSFIFLSMINSICFTSGVLFVYLYRLLQRTIWKDDPDEDEEDDY